MSLAKKASMSKSQERRERRKRSYEKKASWQKELFHIQQRMKKESSYAEKAAEVSSGKPEKPKTAGEAYRGAKK